ncbi:MAG: signal peptidase I [bacterium]|nr:signal peptidase I [bacterium]
MKKLLTLGYYIFIGAIIILALLLISTLFPIPGNFQVKVVQSGSMEPAISTGAIVIIKPQENYEVEDVVTFGKDTKTDVPTTHRIINVRAVEGTLLYTTKGDANEDPDARETPQKEIIGKVILDIPRIGYIIDFARKPLGFLLLIIFPAVIIVGDEVVKIFKELKKLKKNKSVDSSHENPQ